MSDENKTPQEKKPQKKAHPRRRWLASLVQAATATHDWLAKRAWYGPNGDLKLFAFAIAAIIFVQIRMHEDLVTEKSIDLPVRVSIHQPAKTVLDFYVSDKDGNFVDDENRLQRIGSPGEFFTTGHKLPKKAKVTFKGRPNDIKKLVSATASCIELEILELTDSAARDNNMSTTKIPANAIKNLDGVNKLKVVSIEPAFIRFAWDNEVIRKVSAKKIRVPMIGTAFQDARPDYEILIDEISVQGSQMNFNRMEATKWQISTEPVDVSRRAVNFIERAKIDIPSDSGITKVVPAYVNVRVSLRNVNRNAESSISGPDIPVPTNAPPDIVADPAAASTNAPPAER